MTKPQDVLAETRRLDLASARARHAQALALALARCSRALLLYDAHNDAVAAFLEELEDLAEHGHGELVLDVAQDRFVLDGETVYLDRDRDRSLPFLLWRDGVRRLRIGAEAGFDQWTSLVELLAVRLSRIRGDEDDLVSMVWRARLPGIQVDAVDGMVFNAHQGDGRRFEHHLPAPEHLDRPPPRLTRALPLAYVPIDDHAVAALVDELSTAGVVRDALRLGRHLVAAHRDELVSPDLLVPALLDLRDHLVRDGHLRGVLSLMTLVKDGHDGERLHGLLVDTLTQADSLLRLLRGVPPDDDALVAELIDLVAGLPGDALGEILALLERDDVGKRALTVVRLVLADAAGRELTRLLHDTRTQGGQRAAQVLLALGQGAPEAARRLVVELAQRPDRAVQEARLQLMEQSGWGAAVRSHLVAMLSWPDPPIRHAATLQLGRRGKGRAAEPIVRAIEGLGAGWDRTDAAVLGQALALTGPTAHATFEGWVRPSGLLARKATGETPREWAAVAGLAWLPSGHTLLRELSLEHRDPFRSHCVAAWREHRQRFGSKA